MTQPALQEEYELYLAPFVECKNVRNDFFRVGHDSVHMCRYIPLPYPHLPAEAENLPHWPPDEWERIIACADCGQVHKYVARDVDWIDVRKSEPGRYRNDTNCFFVKVECASRGCTIPSEFHIEMFDKSEDDLQRTIKKGFVGEWPTCGHSAMARPFSECTIKQVYLGPI